MNVRKVVGLMILMPMVLAAPYVGIMSGFGHTGSWLPLAAAIITLPLPLFFLVKLARL